MSAERLHADWYQDQEFHVLTMDIIFYGGVYMDEDDFVDVPAEPENDYWKKSIRRR